MRDKNNECIRFRKPGVSAWMEACYRTQPPLFLGSYSIRSCCGGQQGDPLGPLGFSVTLQLMVERIKSEVPSLKINSWYLDDGTLMGSPADLESALEIVEAEGPTMGLLLNRSKSVQYVPLYIYVQYVRVYCTVWVIKKYPFRVFKKVAF